jgi:hypothetical protein
MFGLSLKDKTHKVLQKDFEYQPNQMQKPVLAAVVSQAKTTGVNEYDAAILFMLAQMNALEPDDEALEINKFVLKHIDSIERCSHKAESSIDDIEDMINQIAVKHGVEIPASGFSEWIIKFKVVCANINEQLSIDDEGKSLIDFMDQTPLRSAYYDRVLPGELAEQFAPTFDARKFGLPDGT